MTLHDQPDTPLAAAILRTILYADVFNFPMTVPEIHHFLISFTATPEQTCAALEASNWLSEQLEFNGEHYALRGRSASLKERRLREDASVALWPIARRYGWLLAHIPFVRMVALTGSLAMHNVRHARDDIDYLIVTEPGRVWLARALVVLVVRLAKLRGVWLCPNYVLARTALEQERQDLYTAHEIVQMIPLAGHDVYHAMRRANVWANDLLPNATTPFYREADCRPRGLGRVLQRLGEVLLSGPLGNALEKWEQRRKQRKFSGETHAAHHAARLDESRVKGHFHDHGHPVMSRYLAHLQTYRLSQPSETQSIGD